MSALGLSLLALIVSLHSLVFSAAVGWYTKQARLWRTDADVARAQEAHPPWFVRYSEWLP